MKLQPVLFSLFVLGLFAFIGCTSPEQNTATTPTDPAFDFEKAKAYVTNEYTTKFAEAFAKGDSAGIAALYTADAMLMPPNSPSVSGTQQIESLLSGFMKSGAKGIKLTTVEVLGGAEGVFARGNYELYGDNNTVIDNGKYCEFWKEENGTWKNYRDIWNSDKPMPQPAP